MHFNVLISNSNRETGKDILNKACRSKLCSFILSSVSQCKIGGNYPIEMTVNCSD